MTDPRRSRQPDDWLIVALDLPPINCFPLIRKIGDAAGAYKLGVGTFLSSGPFDDGLDLARYVLEEHGKQLMLDLKLYDTRDTVKRTMEIVAKLGAHMVTVHADCAEHAVGFGPKVLAVRRLTDGTGLGGNAEIGHADGIICSVIYAQIIRDGTDKLLVCPGIRPAGTGQDNHLYAETPRKAIDAGADYIVVGRPIIAAPDPVAAARAVIAEIEAATDAEVQP